MRQEIVTVVLSGRPWRLFVRADRYGHGGGLAVQLFDSEDDTPFATLSVNVEVTAFLQEDEFIFKTYSENAPFLQPMLKQGFVEMTGLHVDVGMAGPQPVCRLLKGVEGKDATRGAQSPRSLVP